MRPALVAFVLLALAGSAAAQEGGMIHAVDEDGSRYLFSPLKLEVDPGSEVVVMAFGLEDHKVRASDKVSFESPVVEPNGTVSFRAPLEPGEYRYYCPFHASADTPVGQGMVGVLYVRESATVREGTPPTGAVVTIPTGATPASASDERGVPGVGGAATALALAAAALLALRRR